jgi:hypothetical protein
MKTTLKIVLATVLLALTIVSCWKRGGETTTPIDTTQAQIDTIPTDIDTAGVNRDTLVP